jgi:hypothetical protein
VREAGKPDLDGAGVIEPVVSLEVDVQPLGQRLQSADALRAVVESGCAGDDQVEAGEPAGVDLVDELVSRPRRKLRAAKWSTSPLTPAALLAEAPTCGCPPSQAIRPSVVAASPSARARR